MYLDELGEIIAVRELYIVEERETDRKIRVTIGKPQPFPDSGYYCPFQIAGIGGEEIKYAAGVDAVQSLQLVMLIIGATLNFLSGQGRGRLRWEGGSEGDLGFPTAV
jgi:hypothetical protein